MRWTTASRTVSTPCPVLALTMKASSMGMARMSSIWRETLSTSALGRSILLRTGMISRPWSMARWRVGHGLGLHALGGVHHQQGPLAGREAPRHLVGEVHVARGVDQVELVGLPVLGHVVHGERVRLDGDAALAFEVHVVEQLVAELALVTRCA